MTRPKDLTDRKRLPKLQRFDLSDVPSLHRVTNATTREPLSLAHEWRGFTARPGSMRAFSLPRRGLEC